MIADIHGRINILPVKQFMKHFSFIAVISVYAKCVWFAMSIFFKLDFMVMLLYLLLDVKGKDLNFLLCLVFFAFILGDKIFKFCCR